MEVEEDTHIQTDIRLRIDFQPMIVIPIHLDHHQLIVMEEIDTETIDSVEYHHRLADMAVTDTATQETGTSTT